MKPAHLLIGIAGSAILIVGAIAIQHKRSYDQDGREITKLIAEYKALGVPTNGSELFHPIPDGENAWTEVGPILLTKRGIGTGMAFKSSSALELLLACGKNDLPLIKQYLAENKDKRDEIEAALKAKPGLQVPHNYNEGYMMLVPEFAAIRPLTREYCLAAYAAGLDGNMPEVRRNLGLANRFATLCTERPEIISGMIGANIRKIMMQTAYRIIEVDPSMTSELKTIMTAPEMSTYSDPKKTLTCEFVGQLELARYFDAPEMDRPTPPAFLKNFINTMEENDVAKLGKVREGDYIPDSSSMRKFLRNRLESWKPFMTELAKSGLPSFTAYSHANDMTSSIPQKLVFMVQGSDNQDSLIYRGLWMAQQYVEMNRVIFKSLEAKAATGSYPKSLESTGIKITSTVPADIFVFTANSTGISIWLKPDPKNADNSLSSLSFPTSLTIRPQTARQNSDKVKDYRSGKVNVEGSTIKIKPTGSFAIPLGAPPRAP